MVDSDVVDDELEMDGVESISRMILVAASTSCAFSQYTTSPLTSSGDFVMWLSNSNPFRAKTTSVLF